MRWKYQVGRALAWPLARILRARWFPLLDTFHLRRSWAYDVCRFARTREIRTIFDVGANVGQTADFAADFFPGAEIHSFEPVHATSVLLRKRMRGRPNVHVHQLALSNTTGSADIQLQPDSVFNSLRFPAIENSTAHERVEVTTVDAFCATQGIAHIDILKTDAQGFDVEVLQGAAALTAKHAICFVYTEVSFDDADPNSTPFRAIHQQLQAGGFQLAGFYEQVGTGPENRALGFCNALYLDPAALDQRFPRRAVALAR